MSELKCPDCGARQFYVKDPEDQFNISEFTLESGSIEYIDDAPDSDRIPVEDNSEIFCEKCAWHDKFNVLK